MAGVERFELPNDGVRVRSLTAWRHPIGGFVYGCGSRILTCECESQSLVPYRLAIPQENEWGE